MACENPHEQPCGPQAEKDCRHCKGCADKVPPIVQRRLDRGYPVGALLAPAPRSPWPPRKMAYPAPEGAPKPEILPHGKGQYVCTSGGGMAGYGSTPTYAWNAWVSRFNSIKARTAA